MAIQRYKPTAKALRKQYAGEIVDEAPKPFGPDNPTSRAVARVVQATENSECVSCDERATFHPKQQRIRILATVVDTDGTWLRDEVFYPPGCYLEAGEPYGPVYTTSPQEGMAIGQVAARSAVA